MTDRGDAANGSVPAQPTRTLETLIAYPAVGTPDPTVETDSAAPAKGPFPMIVYVHGFPGGYESPYMHYWAQAGFVVVAPMFPLTRHDAPGGPTLIDLTNEPGDVSFVLDEMHQLPGGRGHPAARRRADRRGSGRLCRRDGRPRRRLRQHVERPESERRRRSPEWAAGPTAPTSGDRPFL